MNNECIPTINNGEYSHRIALGLVFSFVSACIFEFFTMIFQIGNASKLTLLFPFIFFLNFIPKILKINKLANNFFSYHITSFIFGELFIFSIVKLYENENLYIGLYIFIIFNIFYHYGEFLFVCYCHPSTLSWDSFLINHSWSYLFAISAGFIEYFIEIYFFENIKNKKIFLILAAIMMTIGHIFRMGAFICARSNFHHQVQWKKANNHVLVTSGIYSISRHPSYFGFFLFALGAQVCLSNFICIITHSIVLWNFFNERIKIEEETLVYFFGDQYMEYSKKTPTLIPFIK